MTITLHSLFMAVADHDALANHHAYAEKLGYLHEVHLVTADEAMVPLRPKYATMQALLRAADDDDILVFADNSVAFSEALAVTRIIGDAPYWLCGDGHWRDRANGGLIMMRAGAAARALVDTMMSRCVDTASVGGPTLLSGLPAPWEGLADAAPHYSQRRWNHEELIGLQTCAHDEPIDGCYPLLLFPSYGYAMPEVRALAVVFNPTVLAEMQDDTSNRMVVRHLTQCLLEHTRPFTFEPVAHEAKSDSLSIAGRLSPAGLVLVVYPDQAAYAPLIEENWRIYALYHGYALSIIEAPRPDSHWLSAMLRAAGQQITNHEFVLCASAEVLIHDLRRVMASLISVASVVLASDIQGHSIHGGIVILRKDEVGRALIAAADAGDDRRVDTILDQAFADGKARLADQSVWAVHGDWGNDVNFLVGYRMLPGNVRELMLRDDAEHILAQLEPAKKEPPQRTAMYVFRHSWLNKAITALTTVLMLIGISHLFS